VYNCDLLGEPMQTKKSSFASLSNEALCKLRDEIAALLHSRAENLRMELDRLTSGTAVVGERPNGKGNGTETARRKIAPKYQGPHGETWTGRGVNPRWLTKALKEGKRPEDFLIARANAGPI
jgi:DNA-binding protein H-NS